MIDSIYKGKFGKEVESLPDILDLRASNLAADLSTEEKDGIKTKLAITGIDVKGEYLDNSSAITAGLVTGDVYSMPYDFTKKAYLLAIVGAAQTLDRNSILVNSPSMQTGYPIYLNVYNTAGTNAPNNVYLDGKVRSDWGDIRMLDANGNYIPFGIIYKEATYITLVFKADLLSGDNNFYIDYNNPSVASNITKIGAVTDTHYDDAEPYANRDQALVHLDNFNTQMVAYAPDLILEGSDKVGAVTTGETGRIALMNAVSSKVSEGATSVGCPKYLWGWGNHDFDLGLTFSGVQSNYNGLVGQVAGTLYAAWEQGDYQYISLDANYKPADDTHHSNSHVGYGYIDAPQRTWLTDTLLAATKPCIILCHQSLAEFDTARIILTKEIYHVQNRVAIRDILEASGKVMFVLQGHTHTFMHNNIKGIPYISICDLNTPPPNFQYWDEPNANLNGRWSTIEIDKGSKIIRIRQEAQINTEVETIYDVTIPYKTSLNSEYGSNSPVTFAYNFNALYNYSGIACDASEIYINNKDWVIVKPASTYNGDNVLSSKTIKIQAITASPNFGRTYWNFALQSGKFKFRFNGLNTTLSEQRLKIERTSDGLIGVYIKFQPDGSIVAYSGLTNVVLQTYTINTYYDFEVVFDIAAKKFDVLINGVLKANQFNLYESSATSLDRFQITTDPGVLLLDNLRIEKYTTPTPSITNIGTV